MFAHGYMPDPPYFLLALPDAFYLWDNSSGGLESVEPTQRVDPYPFLQPYYDRTGISPDDITERSFEFIVTSWLNQVLVTKSPQELLTSNEDWLVASGLFDRLVGGRLELEAAG
jgi:hypothetical protein